MSLCSLAGRPASYSGRHVAAGGPARPSSREPPTTRGRSPSDVSAPPLRALSRAARWRASGRDAARPRVGGRQPGANLSREVQAPLLRQAAHSLEPAARSSPAMYSIVGNRARRPRPRRARGRRSGAKRGVPCAPRREAARGRHPRPPRPTGTSARSADQLEVVSEVHLAHAAAAEQRHDSIPAAEDSARLEASVPSRARCRRRGTRRADRPAGPPRRLVTATDGEAARGAAIPVTARSASVPWLGGRQSCRVVRDEPPQLASDGTTQRSRARREEAARDGFRARRSPKGEGRLLHVARIAAHHHLEGAGSASQRPLAV